MPICGHFPGEHAFCIPPSLLSRKNIDTVRGCRRRYTVKDETRSGSREPSLLIADDDEELRITLGSAFEPMGFHVYLAPGGTRAVRLARENTIDIAILDINMPDLSGIEALRRIRRIRRSVECIFITSDSTASVRKRALFTGGFTIVRKPIMIEKLRCAVREILGRQGVTGGGDARRRPGTGPGNGLDSKVNNDIGGKR